MQVYGEAQQMRKEEELGLGISGREEQPGSCTMTLSSNGIGWSYGKEPEVGVLRMHPILRMNEGDGFAPEVPRVLHLLCSKSWVIFGQ